MKLVILGGVAAQKVSTLLKSAADNLDITVYKDLITFIEQSSVRPPQIDRMLVMQDAYTKCDGDKQAAMEQFAHYIGGQFPELRVISIGADEEFLDLSSRILASPLYVTLRSMKGSARIFNDIAMLPIDRLRTAYAQDVITSDVESVMITESTPTQPAAPAPVEKKHTKGLFGRRKDKPSKAGTSPAPSLTAGQGSGFGATQSSTNPFNTPFSAGGSNPFDTQGSASNPFDSQSNGTGNSFGSQSKSTNNPFESQGSDSNPFGSQSDSLNPFANQSGNVNPFEGHSDGTDASGGNKSLFGGSADTADNGENAFSNPFAQHNTEVSGTNSFESTSKSNSANPFEAAASQQAKGTSFDMGKVNTDIGSNPFALQSNPFDSQGFDDEFEEAEPQSNAFTQNPFNSFSDGSTGSTESRENQVLDSIHNGVGENSAFSQPFSSGGSSVQNPFESGATSGLGAPVRRSENMVDPSQNLTSGAQLGSSSHFETPSGFGESSRINSNSEIALDDSSNSEIEEADESMGFINSPYMPQPTAEPHVDMSRLKARSVADQYNFKDAVAATEPRTPKRAANVEEVSGLQTQMGIIDDTSYQMQVAPTRVVERIVEKEVYIDTGGETPAQKLLEAGKQVTIIVTGDRRSGVTYTCLTLAALYAKRISTLVVDLDTETCGGQLYQDLESLMGEEENVQHGVVRAKNATLLSNLVHHDSVDGYDYLFSLIGNEPATANDVKALQSALMAQRSYQLVIVDCPWSKISLLDELVTKSKILICVDPDITGCHNTVELLNDLEIQDRLVTALERSGAYIAKQGGSVDNLTQNMRWISDAFEAKNIDWASLRILGTASREGLIECMKKL